WLLPMMWLTGGVERYVAASVELYESTVRATTVLDPSGGWLRNATGLAEAFVLGLGALLPILLAILLGGLGRRLRGRVRLDSRAWLFAGWILPPLAVYTFVHLRQHGYLLTVLPACAILVARPVAHALRRGDPGAARPAGSTGLATARRAAVATGPAGALSLHAAFFLLAGPAVVPFPPAM